MTQFIALLDIGNTAVTYGYYGGGRLLSQGSVLHHDIPKKIAYWSKSGGESNTINLVISSVVPKMTQKIKQLAKTYSNLKPWVAGRDLPVQIKHNYRNINKLGIDRAVNIYGALRIYKPPFILIDYGTAITMDYVSPKGIFEGGMIIPGPEIAFQALLERAALIPKSLRLPKNHTSFLGHTTYDCMRSGTLEGYGALTDELVRRFRKRFHPKARVLVTGGFSAHLKPYTQVFQVVDPALSIKSLLLLFKAASIFRARHPVKIRKKNRK